MATQTTYIKHNHIHTIMKSNLITKVILFLLFTISTTTVAAVKPLDHIVAIINDDVITATMLENRLDDFRKQLGASQLSRIKPADLKKQVLERMIRDMIQTQQAKQFGITLDDLKLNRMLETLASNNNMSLDDFRKTIENDGINYARYREQTREEIIIKQLQQRIVHNKVNVSNQEVQQYIESNELSNLPNVTYHLSHILIATPESASSEDINKAEKKSMLIYDALAQGKKFEDQAIKESNGRNALKGGDLGIRKATELPQIFIDAVKSLTPGEVSKPVKSASGFHLLKLVSRSNTQALINQTHIRHILIKPTIKNDDEHTRQKLNAVKQELAGDKDFSELANQYSEDPGSKSEGGDLGWTSPGELTPIFENVANSLSVGEVSEPFKTKFGWHILEVLGHREHNKTKTNKKNQARTAIQNRKIDEELRLWLRRIRDQAYVEFISD